MEDIEDLVNDEEIAPDRKRLHVFSRAKKKTDAQEKVYSESVIPGNQTVFIKTWGCSHNNSDSEYMAGQLDAYGYTITDQKDEAHLWLLNSCTVKTPSELHFKNAIIEGKSKGKKIVVAGCVPQADRKLNYISDISVIGVQQIDRVVEVVEETLKGFSVRLLSKKRDKYQQYASVPLDMPKIRKNPLIEILAINSGCLNQCTYCKTKHARGDLRSYLISELVERATHAFDEGVRELWLTSEDLGAYGHDIDVTLPMLLWELIDVIPDQCFIRLGMTNPPYILDHLEEMAKILNHPKVYKFLHIPVQSGSDGVLGDMKREYCVEKFRHIVDYLKLQVPGITIATDIICGYPTETWSDFVDTMELVRMYKFPSLFINQFFPRPGTPAALLPRISTKDVKQRTRELSELFQSYWPHEGKAGASYNVLVTEVSNNGKHVVGHNIYYDQVLVPYDSMLMGRLVNVTVQSTGKYHLMGKVCAESDFKTIFMSTVSKYSLQSILTYMAITCFSCGAYFCVRKFVLSILSFQSRY